MWLSLPLLLFLSWLTEASHSWWRKDGAHIIVFAESGAFTSHSQKVPSPLTPRRSKMDCPCPTPQISNLGNCSSPSKAALSANFFFIVFFVLRRGYFPFLESGLVLWRALVKRMQRLVTPAPSLSPCHCHVIAMLACCRIRDVGPRHPHDPKPPLSNHHLMRPLETSLPPANLAPDHRQVRQSSQNQNGPHSANVLNYEL